MNEKCPDCDGTVEVPADALDGEIVSCPDCGLEMKVVMSGDGQFTLQTILLEKEDWGE